MMSGESKKEKWQKKMRRLIFLWCSVAVVWCGSLASFLKARAQDPCDALASLIDQEEYEPASTLLPSKKPR
jgi:hypothetical protein